MKQEKDRYAREISNLFSIGKQREQELKNLEDERKLMSKELANAKAAKCDALIQAEEVKAKEIALSFREQRLANERELMQQQTNSLTEDLSAVTDKATSVFK